MRPAALRLSTPRKVISPRLPIGVPISHSSPFMGATVSRLARVVELRLVGSRRTGQRRGGRTTTGGGRCARLLICAGMRGHDRVGGLLSERARKDRGGHELELQARVERARGGERDR